MAFDWETHAFSSLIKAGALEIGDGYRAKNDELGGDGPIFLRAGHVSDSGIDFSGVDRFTYLDADRFGSKLSQAGDVVITTKGNSTGRVTFVTPRMPPFVYSPHLSYWRTKSGSMLLPGFLKAWSRGQEFATQLSALSRSTDMAPYLSLQDQRSLKITVPPVAVQQAISALAIGIDDRIDHNRALATNLEAIARTLFKSWFVDFDPVRAKAAGEAPSGLAPDLAALFPDRFVDSEMGEIPEGWQAVALSQLVEVERGLSYKGSGLAERESGRPMHNLNSVLEGGGYKYAGIKYYSGDYKARHLAKAGDIVVANTEQGHKHLLIGCPAIIPASYDEGLFSHHLYRVRLLTDAKATKNWMYYALMAPEVRDQIIGHANGSTVNMLKPSGLQVPLVVLPPITLCEQFEALAASLRARIENCIAESSALTELRDLLLPRLISGKLRVEDAQAALVAA